MLLSPTSLSNLNFSAAIERNLESEEQERVSADMRIRKSQVKNMI